MPYPYVQSPEKFTTFLKRLPEMGQPTKFDTKVLKSLGYTSSNDSRFIQTIKFIGLLDPTGVPTPLWREMRANARNALAKGLHKGYADLFSQYPDAHQRDDEALRTFFSAHTKLGVAAVAKVVSTFKAICQLADFSAARAGLEDESDIESGEAKAKTGTKLKAREATLIGGNGMTVNINVQLQVPADATGEIYDKFFEAMRKHLWPTKQ
jgi:hypothetical protein